MLLPVTVGYVSQNGLFISWKSSVIPIPEILAFVNLSSMLLGRFFPLFSFGQEHNDKVYGRGNRL